MDKALNKPLVSIIMPAYNAEEYLEETLNTIKNQTFTNWELIVINDGSTDRTEPIVEYYQKYDSRIRLINQENKKAGAARNKGLEYANGEWIAFIDADDIWEVEKLDKQLSVAKNHPAVDIIYSDGWVSNSKLEEKKSYGSVKGLFTGSEMYKLLMYDNYVPILSVLVKKNVIDKVGKQEEEFLCEDWDYWIRIAKSGYKFFGMEDKTFIYRKHISSTSANEARMELGRAFILCNHFDKRVFSRKFTNEFFLQLLIRIVRTNEFKNIEGFLRMAASKHSSPTLTFFILLVKSLRRKSVFPLRFLNKINKLY